ncbi:hypothetical protein [Ferruginibacter sp.]|uniref:hypothetical protein n=1 Tax=Ferruginibacter sp. TaxID=1940288 RepID=UPI00265B6F5E|nr:hypothetical protein [Ferruginibacter sp.]
MKKTKDVEADPIAPELKHDTMEYAASTEGDDQLNLINEDDEITADELDSLEEDDMEDEAYALDAAATDTIADENNFLTIPDDVDELENVEEEDDKDEFKR